MAAFSAASGIAVSRVLGFARDRVFAHHFGTGALADAWGAALRIPNFLQSLVGEGSLGASFIPVYARMIENGRERDAGRLAGAVLGLVVAAAGALALLGVLAAPALVWVVAHGFADDARAEIVVDLLRVLFPMAAALVVSAWSIGVLNSHRRFFASYAAPATWNLAMIVAVVAAAARGLGDVDLLGALAWGALVGGLAQALFHVPFLLPHLRHVRPSLTTRARGAREVVRNFLPAAAARGAVYMSGLLDLHLASWLAIGAVGMLSYAQRLHLLPISLFAMSVAAAALPELARDGESGLAKVRARTQAATTRTLHWLVPVSAGYVVFADAALAVFRTGEFGADDVAAVGWVLAAYAVGLPASGVSRVLASAFHALGDTRRPAWIALARIAVSAAVGLALMFPLDRISVGGLGMGAVGLALGATVGAWLELGLLATRLSRKLGRVSLAGGRLPRYLLATAFAVGVGAAVERPLSALPPLAAAGATILAVAATYLALARWMGVSEVRLPRLGRDRGARP